MNIKKLVMLVTALMIIIPSALIFNVSAASTSDYVALKYAKMTDAGANTVTIEGKGIMNVKPTGSVNDATAILFKDYVTPKNFKATLSFLKDYGDGAGKQAGWYAVNFSETPNWFTSVNGIIKSTIIKGVNFVIKLDATDKRKIFIEISRYSPGYGFKNILAASIEATLKADWICNFEVKAGKFYVDGAFITDLNDSIDLSFTDGRAFVGFGGFSEEFRNVIMNVKYDKIATKNDIAAYGKNVTTATTLKTSQNTATSISQVASISTTATTVTSANLSSSEVTSISSATPTTSPSTTSKKQENSSMLPIIIIIAILVLGGGGAAYFIMKSKGTTK